MRKKAIKHRSKVMSEHKASAWKSKIGSMPNKAKTGLYDLVADQRSKYIKALDEKIPLNVLSERKTENILKNQMSPEAYKQFKNKKMQKKAEKPNKKIENMAKYMSVDGILNKFSS